MLNRLITTWNQMDSPFFWKCWEKQPDESINTTNERVDFCNSMRKEPWMSSYSHISCSIDISDLGCKSSKWMDIRFQSL